MSHDRFSRTLTTDEVNQKTLARIEQAMTGLVDALSSLNMSPQVDVQAPRVPTPQVDVSVPTQGIVEAVTEALGSLHVESPQVEIPAMPSVPERIIADVDLTSMLEEQEKQRLVMEAVKEKIGNLTAGRRSHFDGRLRNNGGLIDSTNPLFTKESHLQGTWDYAADIEGIPTIPDNAKILTITATTQSAAASMVVNGGDGITIPPNTSVTFEPHGTLVGPDLEFTDTSSYVVDWIL